MQIVGIVLIILFVVVFLQILLINLKISSAKSTILKQGLMADSDANEVAQARNQVRMYSLVIDMVFTDIVSNASNAFQNVIREEVDKSSTNLIYVCDQSVKDIDVTITKVGLLVVENNSASEELEADIKNQAVRFLVLKNKVFLLKYLETVNLMVQDYLDKNKNTRYNKNLRDPKRSKVFVIISTFENTPNVPVTSDCRHDIIPFFGEMGSGLGSNYFMDINNVVFPSNISPRIAIHALGYKTNN